MRLAHMLMVSSRNTILIAIIPLADPKQLEINELSRTTHFKENLASDSALIRLSHYRYDRELDIY